MESYRPNEARGSDVAHLGRSVIIRGELSGSEDLYVDGEVEGNIELRDHNLTVGPNGRIRANVNAKQIIVHGKIDGNLTGTDRVELKKSAVLVGDIVTRRIVIEDGAYFKGGIDLQKETAPAARDQGTAANETGTSTPVTSVSSPVPVNASASAPSFSK